MATNRKYKETQTEEKVEEVDYHKWFAGSVLLILVERFVGKGKR